MELLDSHYIATEQRGQTMEGGEPMCINKGFVITIRVGNKDHLYREGPFAQATKATPIFRLVVTKK